MEIDRRSVDHVLRTTRSVRTRLDLTRPVGDELLFECIDLAEQAPTGGNISSRRWMVVRDPATKTALADLYRAAGGDGIIGLAERLRGTGHRSEKVMASGAYLAQRLQDVPVIVIACIWGQHDASGRPGLFDSVLQAAWSFCLAARARGLGTAWTTLHLAKADEVAALLGIPEGVTQAVLLPVAHTTGGDFHPAARWPAPDITYFDRWGYTRQRPSEDGSAHLDDAVGVTVEVDVHATPARVWRFVSDITVPARFSGELQRAEWLDPGPAEGARFVGHNRLEGVGEWQTTSWVMRCDAPKVFAWHVVDADEPGAQWSFELEPIGRTVRLRQHVTLGPGFSGTAAMIRKRPEREQPILERRLAQLRASMQRTVEGIKALAESPDEDAG
jgi:nitroreductase